jgi:hypothetical protein
LIFLVGINYISDPASLFNGDELRIAKYISNGFNVTGFVNVDERILQKKIIEEIKFNPNTIILGSSRIMMIGKDYYGLDSFNNGVSGASIEDIITIYHLNRKKNVLPKRIVIGLDPWLFNNYSSQNRWKSLKKEYDEYYIRKSDRIFTYLPIHKYFQLFSISYLQTSIKNLPKKIKNENKIVPTKYDNNKKITKISDGTISYSENERNLTKKSIDDSALRSIEGAVYSLDNFNNISKDILLEFQQFIKKLQADGIKIEILFLPYHPTVWNHLNENIKYSKVKEIEKLIYANYSNTDGIIVKGSYDPIVFNLISKDFYDGMHLSPSGIKKVLSQ